MSKTAVAAPGNRIQSVDALLKSDAAIQRLQSVASGTLTGERLMRVMALAAHRNPKLKECEPMSLLGALMTCAQLSLEPNTTRGLAHIIPYKNRKAGIIEAQLVIGYKGYIDLAFRSGILTYVDAGVHYSDDEVWRYKRGLDLVLDHVEGPQDGTLEHAYAIAKWQNDNGSDGTSVVVLPWAKIQKVRDGSQGWQTAVRYGKTDKSPWTTHTDAMAMKTAIRALAQSGRMPMSPTMKLAMQVDNKEVPYRELAQNPSAFDAGSFGPGDVDTDVVEGDVVDDGEEDSAPPAADREQERPKEEPKNTAPPRERKKQEPEPEAKQDDGDDSAAGRSDADVQKTREDNADRILNELIDVSEDQYDSIIKENQSIIDDLKANAPELYASIEGVLQG